MKFRSMNWGPSSIKAAWDLSIQPSIRMRTAVISERNFISYRYWRLGCRRVRLETYYQILKFSVSNNTVIRSDWVDGDLRDKKDALSTWLGDSVGKIGGKRRNATRLSMWPQSGTNKSVIHSNLTEPVQISPKAHVGEIQSVNLKAQISKQKIKEDLSATYNYSIYAWRTRSTISNGVANANPWLDERFKFAVHGFAVRAWRWDWKVGTTPQLIWK